MRQLFFILSSVKTPSNVKVIPLFSGDPQGKSNSKNCSFSSNTLIPLSVNFTKWSNIFKQLVDNSRWIVWVCLTILWGWRLKGYWSYFSLRGFENSRWRVFFHFVGACPGSTDLAFFLQRLTKEVKPDMKDIVSDLETLIQLTNSLLSNKNTEPVLIFIDAVNQVKENISPQAAFTYSKLTLQTPRQCVNSVQN